MRKHEPQFTADYLVGEINRFREEMGLKRFWLEEGRKDAAVKALGYVYLNAERDEGADHFFQITLSELAMRDALVAVHA